MLDKNEKLLLNFDICYNNVWENTEYDHESHDSIGIIGLEGIGLQQDYKHGFINYAHARVEFGQGSKKCINIASNVLSWMSFR